MAVNPYESPQAETGEVGTLPILRPKQSLILAGFAWIVGYPVCRLGLCFVAEYISGSALQNATFLLAGSLLLTLLSYFWNWARNQTGVMALLTCLLVCGQIPLIFFTARFIDDGIFFYWPDAIIQILIGLAYGAAGALILHAYLARRFLAAPPRR